MGQPPTTVTQALDCLEEIQLEHVSVLLEAQENGLELLLLVKVSS